MGQTDDFPEKLKAGCKTPEACRSLEAEARARTRECKDNTIGYLRCSDANADLERATALVREWDIRREDAEREEEKRVQRSREEERRAAEEEKRVRDAEQRQREQRDWDALELTKCATTADPPTCEVVRKFVGNYPRSDRASEARRVLHEAEYVERARVQAEAEAEAEREAAKKPPRPASTGNGFVKCCDGSTSPSCRCSRGSFQGCCSHHGGVCGGCD